MTRGLYLYGVVRARPSDGKELALDGAGVVELLRIGALAAVVRRVPLSDFSPEAIEKRFRDKAWLESTARDHNAVTDAIHGKRPLLPAKFGAVYANVDDLSTALRNDERRLLAALTRVDGCDEWAVHLHVDERHLARNVRETQREGRDRRPGHAYFQQRRLEREHEEALANARNELASAAFDALARRAVDARLATPSEGRSGEVLRAAFLVRRDAVAAFLDAMSEFAKAHEHEGIRLEYSGPLPPYSFVSADEEEAA